jgi:glycosyltransferase involved in cell wall biosynthesis
MSLCLCMIVKNEAAILETTLGHLCDRIQFSYWVISDTGSTDNTRELIRSFFSKRGIPGELVEHKWKDFGYNRTKALECAYMKTDYLMVFDADDSIVGTMQIPQLKEDRYVATFERTETYYRPLIITNRKKWMYKGVLHEYLDAPEVRTTGILKGDYYIHSGRTGSRNQNKQKYVEDARLLEKAFHEEQDESLKDRYAFYCAQSHMDAKHVEDSIQWYTICLKRNGWKQERYYACLQLGKLYAYQQKRGLAMEYWRGSVQYDAERIEGVVMAATYAQLHGDHKLVNTLYHQCKGYNKTPFNKLFLQTNLYAYEIEYLNSKSAYFAKDPSSGYDCCKTIMLYHRNKDRMMHCIRILKMYKEELKKDKDFTALLQSKLPKEVLNTLL